MSFLPRAVDPLVFPATSLAKTGVYRYRVLSLPAEAYPRQFLLKVPDEEVRPPSAEMPRPWDRCVVRASLQTLDGRVFYVRTIHLGEDNRALYPGTYPKHQAMFLFPDARTRLPPHRDYVLQIEVLRPSERVSDSLRVDAAAKL